MSRPLAMDTGSKRKRSQDASEQDGGASANKQLHIETDDTMTDDTPLVEGKVFNDSVHGHIEMHPLLVDIIDTPEFQRLRFIKQLGMCYFVYPGAAHNRFEHSLGVSYLAGELARSLQKKQKCLHIKKEDILCVEIAGLCHDLGHGPFSHLFDESFLPRVKPDYRGKHEKLSVDMLEHMLEKDNLREKFTKHGLTDKDITFIKEQIVGVGAKQHEKLSVDMLEKNNLREKFTKYGLTDRDITFIKEQIVGVGAKQHEKLSVDMLEHILEKNNLREEFTKYGLTDEDITFIKEQIVVVGAKQHEKLSVDVFEHMLEKKNLREKFTKYGLIDKDITFIKEQIVGVGAKQHEKLSVDMFEHMLEKNNLREKFTKYGLTDKDITFIKEQIVGVGAKQVRAKSNSVPTEGSSELPISTDELLTIFKQSDTQGYLHVKNDKGESGLVPVTLVEEVWPYEGRDKDKSFLYEIVANKRNGIDVDKWDYFARDSLYLGISNPFDWRRYLKFARVLNVEGDMQICTRDKEITNLYDMFHTRYTLHQRAYQHRVNKILEAMIVDALIAADDYLFFAGKDGKMKKMSASIYDMEAYSKLTDHVMWNIHASADKKLDQARQIIDRIMKRDLYNCVGQTHLKKDDSMETPSKQASQPIDINKKDFERETEREIYEQLNEEAKEKVARNDIVVHIASYSYGMGEKDPVRRVKFYPKSDPTTTVEISSLIDRDSMAMPKQFSERYLWVCVKQNDRNCADWVKQAFEDWCKSKHLKAKPGDFSSFMSESKKPNSSHEMKSEAAPARRQINYGSTPLNRNSQSDPNH